MTAQELKLATTLAKDRSFDCDGADLNAVDGFGLPDFEPVHVGLKSVVRVLRWQCCCMDGSWDERQYNDDRPHLLRNVHISDMMDADLRAFLINYVTIRLGLQPEPLQAAA